jgi:hypothetical protein
MTGMHVRVDKTGCDKLIGSINGFIDCTIERFADMKDRVALVNNDAILNQPMAASLMSDKPARSDHAPHARSN